MAQQTINLGTVDNDGTGDDLRSGGDKINDNFTELYGTFAGYQPLDSDLTAIAALTTTSYGRAFLALADAAAARAALGIVRAIPSGRYFIPEGVVFSGVGAAPTTGIIKAFLGYIRYPVTIDALGVRVTTLAASGNVQLAVYAAHATTLAPTGAALNTPSSLSTASAVAVEQTGQAIVLAPGFYWFMSNSDASANTAVYFSVHASATGQLNLFGSSSLTTALTALTGIQKAVAFNTWPTFTGSFSGDSWVETANSTVPLIACKAA